MIPKRACARASAASKSRYFCTRFSSENTCRMLSVVKILRNTAESRMVEGIEISLLETRQSYEQLLSLYRRFYHSASATNTNGHADLLRLYLSRSAIQSALCERQR